MKTAQVTWDLPTERESGNPLPLSEIAGADIFLSADLGVNFSQLGTIFPVDPQEWVIPDLINGDYVVRLVVVDTDSNASVPADAPFVVDDSNPNPVVNISITFI